jgi:YD repeat-containing protein|eukprot:gene15114-15257_t
MKLSHPNFFIAPVATVLFAINICNAQSGKQITVLQAPPSHITIDGDIKEWGDSLRYYNAEKRINYSIANTKDTLYMAIRVNDRSEQMRILRAGITFSIDPKGKKKETYSITFPLNVAGGAPVADLKKDEAPVDVTQEDRDELMRARLTNLRGIKVVGFKDIEGDMITTSNTYGFQTAVNYDDKGYLICEAAIPMSFFHADDLIKNEWAFNFKINGLQRKSPGENGGQEGQQGGRGGRGGGEGGGFGGGGGRGGRGGRGGSHNSEAFGPAGQGEMFKSEDFWEKFYLAK